MPVTELALLYVKPSTTGIISPTLTSILLKAQKLQSSFAAHPVFFFSQFDDPSYIYLFGGWKSPEQHYNEWIPSSTNQGLMKGIQDEMDVDWMYHIDVRPDVVRDVIGTSGLGVAVAWVSVKDGLQGRFMEKWEVLQRKVEGRVCGGWRIEKGEEGTGVFVMFCGLRDSEEDRFNVGSLEDFGLVKDLATDVKVKQLVSWTGEIEDM